MRMSLINQFDLPLVVLYCLALLCHGELSCRFPEELTSAGDEGWYSSSKGAITFVDDTIIHFHPCRTTGLCSNLLEHKWKCQQRVCGGYLMRTVGKIDLTQADRRGYMCIYLFRKTKTKYMYYVGPQALFEDPFNEHLIVSSQGNDPPAERVCDLDPFNLPVRAHGLLIRNDFEIAKKQSVPCPKMLSRGTFIVNQNDPYVCATGMHNCDGVALVVQNPPCFPKTFLS